MKTTMQNISWENWIMNAALLTISLAVGCCLAVHAAGGQQQQIPVEVAIAGPADFPSAGIRVSSDGKGSYSAKIYKDGQLRLLTGGSKTRAIAVDFTGYTGVNCQLPFTGAGLVTANIVTLGWDDDDDGVLTEAQLDPGDFGDRLDLLAIPMGSPIRAGLTLSFPIGSGRNVQKWRIRWGGGEEVGGVTAGLVTVERTSEITWVIYASADDPAAIRLDSQVCGVYAMPFIFHITR